MSFLDVIFFEKNPVRKRDMLFHNIIYGTLMVVFTMVTEETKDIALPLSTV